jgi:hypothetical protein
MVGAAVMKRGVIFLGAAVLLTSQAANAQADRCATCREQNRLLAPLPCSAVTAPGWSLTSPFGPPSAALPPALRDWCLLTAPVGTRRPSLGVPVSTDLPNVFPQSSAFAYVLWPALRERFLEQSSVIDPLELTPATLAPVDVAIIDDAWDRTPLGGPGDGYRRHGRTLGLMIAELACPSGQSDSCPLYLSNHRALRCDGGQSGTRVHLARSIYDAVIAWQNREATRSEPARLIINLSVGFEADGQIDNQLVQRAIELATCHGALVIAAAGNVLPDGSGSGMLLPGGFESLSVPADCSTFALSDPHGFVAAPLARPLVQAASGIEARDGWLPVFSTRPAGLAAIAAPAFQAVVADPLTGAPSGPSDVLTGSSVAAAVTSAIASVLWAHLPGLDPLDVVNAIQTSSLDLGDTALAGVCPALAHACQTWSSPACVDANVGALTCVAPSSAQPPWAIELVDEFFFPNDSNSCVQIPGDDPETSCTSFTPAPAQPVFCPSDTGGSVGPQPGNLGCGACALDTNTSTLYLLIDSTYKGAFIAKEVSFLIGGGIVRPYPTLDLPVLQAGDKLQVQLVPIVPGNEPPANAQALIEYVAMPYEPYRLAPLEWW